MTKSSDLERIERAVRRRGMPASPSVKSIIPEFRTPGPLDIRPPRTNLRFYEGFQIMARWTFGVPYGKINAFNTFLDDNEQAIADACTTLTQGNARYAGTWSDPANTQSYFSIFQYKNKQAIDDLKAALKTSPNFRSDIKGLTEYWKIDPQAKLTWHQPGAVYIQNMGPMATMTDPLIELLLEP